MKGKNMILDEPSYLKIAEIVRKSNDEQMVKLQNWTKEYFVSKTECGSINNRIKNELIKIIIPLKIRVYGIIFAMTFILLGLQIYSFIKK